MHLMLFEFLCFLAHIVCRVQLCLIERRLVLHEKQKVCVMRLNRKHVGLLIVNLVPMESSTITAVDILLAFVMILIMPCHSAYSFSQFLILLFRLQSTTKKDAAK